MNSIWWSRGQLNFAILYSSEFNRLFWCSLLAVCLDNFDSTRGTT